MALSTAEFRLLTAFIEHVGIVLSRDQLLDLTVGRTADGFDRAIDNQVSRLRKKIEADPEEPDADQDPLGRRLLLHRRGGPGMMLLWRRSLAARFLLLVLFALALSQAITFLVSWGERGQALHAAAKGEFVSRTSSLALLLETTPPSLHPGILDVSGTAYTRFWTSRDGPSDPLDLAEGGVHAALQAAAGHRCQICRHDERAGFERASIPPIPRCRRACWMCRPTVSALSRGRQNSSTWTPRRTAWAFRSASTTASG